MNYKQKYKEALERAKNIRFGNPQSVTANVVCEEIFPELKESEDEKIRKTIFNVFKSHPDYEKFYGVSVKDILAWLEKQGEQKPAWSEEDERRMQQIISDLEQCTVPGFPIYIGGIELEINWLKSLKQRMKGKLI